MSNFYQAKHIYPLLILVIFFSLFFVAHHYNVCINVSPSMKEGIYMRDYGNVQRGDIVAFCLEEPYKSIGLKKFYIEKGTLCQGTDPLLKAVIAMPGDDVLLTDHFIQVNKTLYAYPTFYRDSLQRKLAIYPRGKYAHIPGYWVVGTHSPYSWDSRYWGEIRLHQILYKLKPVFTWN